MAAFSVVVEGTADAAAVQTLLDVTGHEMGSVYITGGKGKLDIRLPGYNKAARYAPWLVIRDLDSDDECAPALVRKLLSHRVEAMFLRIPVRSIEAWMLADRQGVSSFLVVPESSIAEDPEKLVSAKEAVVALARSSKNRYIKSDIVPREGLTRRVGPGYTSRLIEFFVNHWNPERAATCSRSLEKCLAVLRSV